MSVPKTAAWGGGVTAVIVSVAVALHGLGLFPFKQANGEMKAPPVESEGERAVPTRERVAKVEVAVEGLKDEVRASRDEVVALKVEQRALGVRLDAVKESSERLEADQRQRFAEQARQIERVLDKLERRDR